MAGPNVLFYYYVSGLSFIIFLGIFLLSPWFSKFLSSKYKHLQVKDQINWDTRFVKILYFMILIMALVLSIWHAHTGLSVLAFLQTKIIFKWFVSEMNKSQRAG